MVSILVTGGTGFIGSHTCLLLLQKGFKLYIIDSEINSRKNVLNKISSLLKFSDEDFKNKINFFHGDIRDISFVRGALIGGIIHGLTYPDWYVFIKKCKE